MTSGGEAGTNGGGDKRVNARERGVLIAFAAFALVQAVANTQTIAADRARLGLVPLGWEIWLWELSSFAGFAVLLLPVRALVRAVDPPRFGWPAALGLLAAGSLAFSLGHVLAMLALRQLGYAVAGEDYEFFRGGPLAVLLYEYRKDALAYAGLTGLLLLVRHMGNVPRPVSGPVPEPEPVGRIEVRDGARTWWIDPADLVLAEAAGNYVELHLADGATRLHRATLAGLEADLAPHGFIRIHRSRLVRRSAVREVRGTPSGDFELVLDGGRAVAGSRRYRARVTEI